VAGHRGGPAVLVGHSYGGAVITDAATGDSQVKALVFVDAFAPAQGETVGQLVSALPGTCAVPANLLTVPYPGAPAGAADDYLKPSAFPSWAVWGSADHCIPPAELLAEAKRAHAHITVIHGAPHLSMIADPGIVTGVILQAARATS
jgi:pimeloyl-ACP methyl ester carboxylesterase